jgi:hypothetical protein
LRRLDASCSGDELARLGAASRDDLRAVQDVVTVNEDLAAFKLFHRGLGTPLLTVPKGIPNRRETNPPRRGRWSRATTVAEDVWE